MAVRVRLTRVGSKKNAIWRVVVADQRSPRDGRFIEMIGHYNPQTEPSQIVIDRERLDHWLQQGAQPSNTVRKLMRAQSSEPDAASSVVPPQAAPEAEPTAKESEPTAGSEASPEAGAGGAAGESAPAVVSATGAEGEAPAQAGVDDKAPEPDSESG